ncbi:hypothetical protein CGQ25_13775 [Sinomonas sp. R1AF57]|nr:hypothetical protein CGQ25_13775 [Sinomonas sp. R1AF57]
MFTAPPSSRQDGWTSTMPMPCRISEDGRHRTLISPGKIAGMPPAMAETFGLRRAGSTLAAG